MSGTGDDANLRPRVQAYLTAQSERPVRVGSLRRFAVGFSWLTYALPVAGLKGDDDEVELILRLGPDYGLFAPYSSQPEMLAMRSLEGSDVPVPRAWWASDDADILGAPFLICEKMEGSAVVPWVSATEPALKEAYRQSLATQFTDALAALHSVDWCQKPVAVLANGIDTDNAARRNVEHWEALVARWAMRPYPMVEWGIRWLKANAPVAPRVAIVHGDYRTGNFLEVDGQVTAILDWELVHLGDPHEDLGWASLPMYMGGTKYISRLAEPDWFYERYSQHAGFEVSMRSLHYYQVFSLLKLTATHMAAARCFEEGRFNDMRMPAMGSQIATCLRQMEKAIERAAA
ncbi:MAG: putative kinase, aminoglycoside phosphotransferase family [Ramlibacter sp.]|nr:putative kinase, aminoglycoside phosphotransferase family [Ramlibacter sp.]